MARSKHKRRVSGKQHKSHQDRSRRLASLLVWHGVGHPGDDDDYVGGIHWPRHLLTEQDVDRISKWAVATPNRWWCRATVMCRAEDDTFYNEVIESELMQACLANDVSHWRVGLMEEAKSRCNPKHIIAEKFETGVIA